ncbi:hypothetical protein L1987_80485 [Smallanthus sonchifolius]|uniref:Uncharacterized protein n=1 Tax=Smallanthus sonchifolius TaxID=185202 RepID=A0ACB8YM51_9ASTR|nr:hypothetical protein L1987_80485 [Smallanthus sonchifolius]
MPIGAAEQPQTPIQGFQEQSKGTWVSTTQFCRKCLTYRHFPTKLLKPSASNTIPPFPLFSRSIPLCTNYRSGANHRLGVSYAHDKIEELVG